MTALHEELTNADRAERCQKALSIYNDEHDVLSDLIDFLADAMHWCCLNEHDFDKKLSMARNHFIHETIEEQEVRL